MDPVWLPEVLRDAGLNVVEYPGWRNRGHGDFGDIWGVIAHHTGGANTPPSEIANGLPTLAGPLSQLHLAKDGTVTVIAAGIAWHAGVGSWPGIPEDDANSCTIGIEAVNTGTEEWSDVQYDAYVRTVAAILTKLGHDADHVIGHKEWAGPKQGKWDPGGINMTEFRADVATVQGGSAMAVSVWDEQFQNFKNDMVSFRTAVRYDDEFINKIHDQVVNGWPQLGHDAQGRPLTLVDSQAAQNGTLEQLAHKQEQLEIKLNLILGLLQEKS